MLIMMLIMMCIIQLALNRLIQYESGEKNNLRKNMIHSFLNKKNAINNSKKIFK